MNTETQQRISIGMSSRGVASDTTHPLAGARTARGIRTRGFTRLELLVVISIMTVVGAMAVPAVLSTTRYRKVNAAMLSASGAIQTARYLSISKGVPYKIAFTAATGTYQIFQWNNPTGALYVPGSAFTYIAEVAPLDHAIPFTAAGGATLGADQTIYFRPGGAVQWVADGTTSCGTALSMTFTYQAVSKNLTVECYGKVTVPE